MLAKTLVALSLLALTFVMLLGVFEIRDINKKLHEIDSDIEHLISRCNDQEVYSFTQAQNHIAENQRISNRVDDAYKRLLKCENNIAKITIQKRLEGEEDVS